MASRILTINTGSSSLKAALYRVAATEKLLVNVKVERIGLADGHLSIVDATGATVLDRPGRPGWPGALRRLLGRRRLGR